jgi:hypothetical protein
VSTDELTTTVWVPWIRYNDLPDSDPRKPHIEPGEISCGADVPPGIEWAVVDGAYDNVLDETAPYSTTHWKVRVRREDADKVKTAVAERDVPERTRILVAAWRKRLSDPDAVKEEFLRLSETTERAVLDERKLALNHLVSRGLDAEKAAKIRDDAGLPMERSLS